MRIATWNVNSVRVRVPQMLPWIAEAQPDVLCLQETKVVDKDFPTEVFREAGFVHQALYGQKTYNGVAILSKLPIDDVVTGHTLGEADPQTRLIRGTVGGVRIVDCYVPNGSQVGSDKFAYKMTWLARLRAELDADSEPSAPVVVLGDMNIALTDLDVWDPFEADGQLLYHPNERQALGRVLAWGLEDTYRAIKPMGMDFSWWDYRGGAWQRNQGFRIDHLFVSRPLLPKVTAITHWKGPRSLDKPSDHIPVTVDLDWP